jgi:hypothetical protein
MSEPKHISEILREVTNKLYKTLQKERRAMEKPNYRSPSLSAWVPQKITIPKPKRKP